MLPGQKFIDAIPARDVWDISDQKGTNERFSTVTENITASDTEISQDTEIQIRYTSMWIMGVLYIWDEEIDISWEL